MTTEQQPDQFSGLGGSYVRDPITGQRTLVGRTSTEPAPAGFFSPTPAGKTKAKAADGAVAEPIVKE